MYSSNHMTALSQCAMDAIATKALGGAFLSVDYLVCVAIIIIHMN